MPALGEYSDVYNTALLILRQKGSRTWFDQQSSLYGCERDGWDFLADSAAGLLGLVAIFEIKRPSEFREGWWREDGPDAYRTLPDAAPDCTSVWRGGRL